MIDYGIDYHTHLPAALDELNVKSSGSLTHNGSMMEEFNQDLLLHSIKTLSSLLCDPKNEWCANGVSILTGTTVMIFVHL